MEDELRRFDGNCPRNVSRDAKYAIRSAGDGLAVALTYVSSNGERWFATTEEHPDLVNMVNRVKTEMGEAPNGPFYINEHGQVIVPAGPSPTYYLAGVYDMPLRFDFEDNILSGEGVDLDGRPLEPGDLWTGPHPGIPYRLKAGRRCVLPLVPAPERRDAAVAERRDRRPAGGGLRGPHPGRQGLGGRAFLRKRVARDLRTRAWSGRPRIPVYRAPGARRPLVPEDHRVSRVIPTE